MPIKPITEVVRLLDAGQAERAWRIFLENYNQPLMRVVHQYENDPERASDCFLFVCEKLCENRFHRLRAFDVRRGVRFRTWLKLVVSHLCIDWRREISGRIRPSAAIARLPEFEQLVYHLRYENGLNLEAAYQSIHALYPEKRREDLHTAERHIYMALKPRQRWHVSFQGRHTVPIRSEHGPESRSGGIELVETNPGPALLVQVQQEHEALLAALSKLNPDQRLLLRLRYQESLPLKEVARLTGLRDASQARHRVNNALAVLGALLTSLIPAA